MMADGHGRRESDLPDKLGAPARRALAQAGCWRLEQVAALTESEIKRMHGIGPKAINQLRLALEQNGLSFAEKKRGNGG